MSCQSEFFNLEFVTSATKDILTQVLNLKLIVEV